MKTNVKGILSTVLACCVIASCATKPNWTPQQRRALQTKNFDESYDNVFRSIKNVLQDDGYIITNQDHAGGLILARKDTDGDSSFKLLGIPLTVENDEGSTSFEISFNVEEISKGNVETRLTITKNTTTNNGKRSGSEVVDPKAYKSIYDKINVEVQRRVASGK